MPTRMINGEEDGPFAYFVARDGLWKFSKPSYACAYYKNSTQNLLNGFVRYHPQSVLDQRLSLYSTHPTKNNSVTIFHCCYEWGEYIRGIYSKINDKTLLGCELIFEKKELIDCSVFSAAHPIRFSIEDFPSFSNYEERFNRVYEELLQGNAYEINLTEKIKLSSTGFFLNDNHVASLIKHFWINLSNRGAYGHLIFLPRLGKIICSNSPEMFFQINKGKITCVPIKGTIPSNSLQSQFCSKDRAELDIVTDMVRSELSELSSGQTKVVRRYQRIEVPGIIHLCSWITSEIELLSLDRVMHILFPGASITGAPKTNVLKIINSIEKCNRGSYCGATLLIDGNQIVSSLNIRTLELDIFTKEILCGVGGGITLRSSAASEYREMWLKMASVIGRAAVLPRFL